MHMPNWRLEAALMENSICTKCKYIHKSAKLCTLNFIDNRMMMSIGNDQPKSLNQQETKFTRTHTHTEHSRSIFNEKRQQQMITQASKLNVKAHGKLKFTRTNNTQKTKTTPGRKMYISGDIFVRWK